MTRNR
ncbi:hypothetical protein VCBJG01_0297, partial [Vibrio cholerae BJG-01]